MKEESRSRIEEKNAGWMTAAEVAAYLHVSRYTVYRYVRAGKLPALRVGGKRLRFDRRLVLAWARAALVTARRRECQIRPSALGSRLRAKREKKGPARSHLYQKRKEVNRK